MWPGSDDFEPAGARGRCARQGPTRIGRPASAARRRGVAASQPAQALPSVQRRAALRWRVREAVNSTLCCTISPACTTAVVVLMPRQILSDQALPCIYNCRVIAHAADFWKVMGILHLIHHMEINVSTPTKNCL